MRPGFPGVSPSQGPPRVQAAIGTPSASDKLTPAESDTVAHVVGPGAAIVGPSDSDTLAAGRGPTL